jgi:hypothetical protein
LIGSLQTPFEVQVNESTTTRLTLLSLADRLTPPSQAHCPDAGNEKFTLILSGEGDVRLSQDTYHFTHAALGEFDMFIAPLASINPEDNLYEAIFNRARQGSMTAR